MLTDHKCFTWLNAWMHINFRRGHDEDLPEPDTRYLMAELNSRRSRITKQLQEFIVMSVNSGVKPDDLSSQVALAMTKGLLPTVLYHNVPISKKEGAVVFLDVLPGGEIPAEAIEITPDSDGGWDNATVQVVGTTHYDFALPGVLPEHAGKYGITYGQVPIFDTPRTIDSENIGFIEKMDAHIPDSYALAGGHLLQLLEKH